MITSKGLGFLAVAVVVFLLAGLTQVGWVYLVDAVLWGIILLSVVIPWVSVAFLSAERHIELLSPNSNSPAPAEGDLLQVSLSLRNRALWPGYFLGMFYDCPVAAPENHRQQFFVTEVTRSGKVSLKSTVEAYRRGMHQLGPLLVESSAPFGLFRRRAHLTGCYPLLVYPKVYPLRRLTWADSLTGPVHQTRKSRTGIDTVGSRQYVPGDPRRFVHWRNTARTGQLMVKEVEVPADRTLYLAFDTTRDWGEGRETTLEYGIKILASAVDYAHRNQIPVKLLGAGIGAGDSVPVEPKPHYFRERCPPLLKNLALVRKGDGLPLADTLFQIPPGGAAVVVVCTADRRAVEALVRASTMLRHLLVVTLQGFGEPDPKEAGSRRLQAAGIPVVRCWQGHIEEALRSLEGLNGLSSRHTTSLKFDVSGGKVSDPTTRNSNSQHDRNGSDPGAPESSSQARSP